MTATGLWNASRLEAFVRLDAQGRLVEANPTAESLLGLSGRSALGRPLADLISPSDSEHVEQLRALLSSQPTDEQVHRVEVSAAPNGRDLCLEMLITRTSEPPGSTVWFCDVAEERADAAAAKYRLSLMEGAERAAKVGSWHWIPETDEQVWSDNLYRLFGFKPGEITPNRARDFVLEQTPPDDRERIAQQVESLRQEGHSPPVQYRLVRPGRPIRRLRSIVTAVEHNGDGRTSIVGVVRDVTDEVRAEHKITAHVAVSNALEEWESLEQGAHRLLRDLAGALELDTGTFWVPVGDTLVAVVLWTPPSLDASDFESATRELRLERGVCLPGRVWEAGEPINFVNVHHEASYGRADAAARAGLRGAVALPALHSDEMLAVLEFHSREEIDLSSPLMRSLRAIGYELGQFLRHRRSELQPISLTRRQLEVIGLAAQGCSGREIAQRLFISQTTVKSHFENVYAKFGVSDRASAVAEAMRYGFIE